LPFMSTVTAPHVARALEGFDAPLTNTLAAVQEGRRRAQALADDRVAEALYQTERYGGLVALRGAVGPGLVGQMRREAEQWRRGGHMCSDGQEDVGRFDTTCTFDAWDADERAAPGLAYGVALLGGLCAALNARRSWGAPVLEPGVGQLACYDGHGSHYVVHKDHSDFGVLPFFGDGLPSDPQQRVVARRRVTAILYLQEKWDAQWGGAFRAHGAPLHEVMEQQARGDKRAGDYVDVLPDCGTLVLFRSTDLAHEVLPTTQRRFALSMWCLQAEPHAQ